MADRRHPIAKRPVLPHPSDSNWRERSPPVGQRQGPSFQRHIVMASHGRGADSINPERHDAENDICKNLIVNYLPQKFSDKDLFDLFVPFGPLHSVKIMREATTGYSYGFGFVNFIRVGDAVKALRAIQGRLCVTKRLKVAYARPSSDDIKNTNVYIKNLPRRTTEAELAAMFGKYGTLLHNTIVHDKETGACLGTAFVRYAHRDQAARAISCMNNYVPTGAWGPIKVALAKDHGRERVAEIARLQEAVRDGSSSGAHHPSSTSH